MHDKDREKASSIIPNLVVPPKSIQDQNPYFNRKPIKEKSLNLKVEELYELGQIAQTF